MPLLPVLSPIWSRLRAWLRADTPTLSARERLRGALGALIGLGACAMLLHALPHGSHWIIAPIGATAVILFAASHTPLAQPWPVVGGYLFGLLSGCAAAVALDGWPIGLALALAVGTGLWLSARFNCLHPPAGALSVLVVLEGPHSVAQMLDLSELTAINVISVLVAAWLVNNLLLGRRYPFHVPAAAPTPHPTSHQAPVARLGLDHADLERAIQSMDTFVDVQEDELVALYNRAVDSAFGRHVGMHCSDVMSRDLVCAQPDMPLPAAWQLMRNHHIQAMPVTDAQGRLRGLLHTDDLLHACMDAHLGAHLGAPLHADGGDTTVGQVMQDPPRTAAAHTPVLELVHLLSTHGWRQVPVVDDTGVLQGMVTQADLIAALYARLALTRPPAAANAEPAASVG